MGSGESYITRNLTICSLLLVKYFSGRQSEKNYIRGSYSTNGGKERFVQVFWWENLRENDRLENPGVDGRIILLGWRSIDWVYMAEDRDRWRALANAVMKLRVQ
jgi:hypothetical protein